MNTLIDLEKILKSCRCSKNNFFLDTNKKVIVSKDIDNTSSCERDCGLIIQLTMYLISNNIDYDLLEDYSIKLNFEK